MEGSCLGMPRTGTVSTCVLLSIVVTKALFSVERLKRMTLSDGLATAMQAALQITYHGYTPLYNIDDCY